jgi:hypothetical protein
VPRKKKVQPKPIETIRFTYRDGEVCDFLIFGDDVKVSLNKEGNIITKGSNNALKHDDLVDRITEWVAGIYLSPQGLKKVKTDFMRSAKGLDTAMVLSGNFPEVTDSEFGSVRKKIYPEVKLRIDAFANAIAPPSGLPAILAAKNQPTVTIIKGTF